MVRLTTVVNTSRPHSGSSAIAGAGHVARYITRPTLSDERIKLNAAGQVQLKLKTPWRDGTPHLVMSPLDFMQCLAALVPQRPLEQEEPATETAAASECEVETAQPRLGRISWARLLKRVFDIDIQHCPNCGSGELKIIAAILDRPAIEKILTHLGLDPQPPPRGRAREVGQTEPA